MVGLSHGNLSLKIAGARTALSEWLAYYPICTHDSNLFFVWASNR